MSTKTRTNFISGFQLSTRKRGREDEKKGGTKQDIDKRKNEGLDLLKKKKEKGIIRENCG
jgi:hypothetical protein